MKNLVTSLATESIFFTKKIKRLHPEFYSLVMREFPGKQPKEKFWNFLHDNKSIPTCKECEKIVPFSNAFELGYQRYCSIRCSQISDETRTKIKSANLKRFGVDHNMKHSHSLELRKKTWIKTLGVDSPGKSKSVRSKIQNTLMQRTGSISPWKPGLKSFNDRHKVCNTMHIQSIAEKVILSKKKSKPFTMPSGKVVHTQGYESFALDLLLETYKEDEICIHFNVPSIKYKLDGKDKLHYPDIFLQKENKIIEVKSGYTLIADLEKNRAKQKAAQALGFEYVFWVFGRKKTELKFYTSLDQM